MFIHIYIYIYINAFLNDFSKTKPFKVSRGEGSKWAAWAATLPTSYTTLGTWPADVAARLKDSNAIAAAALARTKVDSGFARASSVLTELFGGGGEVSREASTGDPTSSTTPGAAASTGASNGVSINSSGGGEQTSVHDDWNVTALAGQLGSIASWRFGADLSFFFLSFSILSENTSRNKILALKLRAISFRKTAPFQKKKKWIQTSFVLNS